MSVAFEISPSDLRAFHRHMQKVAPAHRRMRWINGGIAALIALAAVSPKVSSRSFVVVALTFLLCFAVIWISMLILGCLINFLLMAIRPNLSGMEGILCEHTVTIDQDGLTETTPVNESRHRWSGVYRVDSTPDHIFIYIQQNMAHVIPRRSFTSVEEADSFFRKATEYFTAARSS